LEERKKEQKRKEKETVNRTRGATAVPKVRTVSSREFGAATVRADVRGFKADVRLFHQLAGARVVRVQIWRA
jgi:hypothetical protein